jgi:hypothetical protein
MIVFTVSRVKIGLNAMKAHKIETVLTTDGTLILQDLPFQSGDPVEIIILSNKNISPSDKNPTKTFYPLRNTGPYYYEDPLSPVGLEDWEV